MRGLSCPGCFFAACIFAVSLSVAQGAQPPKATWSAENLRAKLLEAQRLIRSVYVSYRSTTGYEDSEYPLGSYLQRIVAAKSPYYFYHVNAHGHDRLDWRDDPLQAWCHITADHWWQEEPVNRTYRDGSLRPQDELPGSLQREFFFLATGLWPLDGRPPPRFNGNPIALRDVAACEEYKVVRTAQEMLDGHWCHVLEQPGRDSLWIDTGRGFSLLARETSDPREGVIMQRFELEGHEEVAPGGWLPRRLRNIQYDYLARTAEDRKRKIADVYFEVLEMSVNQVDDSLFQFHPPPGALLVPLSGQPVQAQPAGLDHLDYLVGWIERNLPRERQKHDFLLAYLGASLILLFIGAYKIWLRWRMRTLR